MFKGCLQHNTRKKKKCINKLTLYIYIYIYIFLSRIVLKTVLGHRVETSTDLIYTVLKRFSLLILLCVCFLADLNFFFRCLLFFFYYNTPTLSFLHFYG